ncbi:MAG TPA: SRPBCC family protein [Gaiellaceae bacterium]
MESTTERVAITRELEIDASPETVWEFLVDPEKIARWKGTAATFDPRPGGKHRTEVIPSHTAAGEVLEIDPPRKLVLSWGWESGEAAVPAGSTTVEYELVPEGAGTRLLFTHRDLPGKEAADSHAAGWDHYHERLAVAATGGDPGRDPWLERME